MKKALIVVSFIVFISCSPRLSTSLTQKLPELPKENLVVVLDVFDTQNILEKEVGEIKAVDNGFSDNCSYYENIQNLKEIARRSGANLVKLTKHKEPDKWSACHRLWARIYKVDNVKKYETEITWTEGRKLTWADFKGEPNIIDFPNALAVTNSSLSYESTSFKLFSNKGGIFIQSRFHNYGSWVLPEGRTAYVLRHEQIHFDITEIYSRKLRKAFSDANITMNNPVRAKSIFESIQKELKKRQDYYDNQTRKGEKKETQQEWEAIVQLELAKYDLYKEN